MPSLRPVDGTIIGQLHERYKEFISDVTSGVSFGLQQCIAFYGENGTVRT